MGVIYTRDLYGNFIAFPNQSYKEKILKSYYDRYHHKLNKEVTNKINQYHKCLIIDFHSYSDEMVKSIFLLLIVVIFVLELILIIRTMILLI